MASGGLESKEKYKVLSGCCPDEECKTKLFFPVWEQSIECTNCGQRHEQKNLHNVEKVKNQEVALHNMLKNVLLGNSKPKKGTDTIKVLGLSNYHCKLLSPLLSRFGMDKTTGKAKLLKDMEQGEQFDCGVLCDRAFLLDQEHIDVNGFGRDQTGSMKYLADTLNAISKVNDGEDRLIPIHADGDGHCLVHAISRSLVGRELFWYPLRDNLLAHFNEHFSEYSLQFQDFIDTEEWKTIIAECDTAFIPPDGEALGLRNIHILGLANVLRRPIILLDSLSGLQSSGDYSGVFLPAMIPKEKCIGKDGRLNKPLCIAWSSSGHNHYIPLVGIKGKPQPRVPRWMIPRAWGLPNDLVDQYIEFDAQDTCVIGGDKILQDRYIQRLCKAMEEVFVERHAVHPSLVADVHQYVYKSTGIVGVSPEEVLETSQKAVQEGRLYRCLMCDAISELTIDSEWLQRGGLLYKYVMASAKPSELQSDKTFSIPTHGLVCNYDPEKDCLVPDLSACELTKCSWCHGAQMRRVNPDGSVRYINGDRTSNRAGETRCQCGFKHFWDSKEYDNLPETFPISLEWGGKVIVEKVVWWQYETDTTLNSNVFEVAQELVQKHFPGEFGSERLVQKVVDTILRQTALKPEASESACSDSGPDPMDTGWRDDTASKIILTGHAQKGVHKEQLTMSETEKEIRQKVSQNAAQQQKRKSMELSRMQEKASRFPQKKSLAGFDGQSPTGSPLSSPRTPPLTSPRTPTEKKIRLQTSDGRTMMINLDMALTYHTLQEKIASELNIPPDMQKIRHGFPPRELAPPSEGKENEPLVLKHGDKLSVEILLSAKPRLPTKSVENKEKPSPHPKSEDRRTFWPQPPSPPRQSWGLFEQDTHSNTAEDMLRELNQNHSSRDSLDMSIASLALMATLTGRDLWGYVQSMPHLFSVGGLFYTQVDRDIGLADGKHCTLPCLPGKVFRYTGREDRLELCLEPHGHYPIEPGIEHKVLNENTISKLGHKLTPGEDGDAGASGSGVGHRPFTGRGHALACGDKMPQDYKPVNALKARSVKSGSFSAELPAAIEEELEETSDGLVTDKAKTEVDLDAHIDKKTTRNKHTGFKRIGPGVSVLDQESVNAVNHQAEFMRARAMSIEMAIAEEEEDDTATQGLTSDMDLDNIDEDNCGQEMDTVVPPSPLDGDAASAAIDDKNTGAGEMDC